MFQLLVLMLVSMDYPLLDSPLLDSQLLDSPLLLKLLRLRLLKSKVTWLVRKELAKYLNIVQSDKMWVQTPVCNNLCLFTCLE